MKYILLILLFACQSVDAQTKKPTSYIDKDTITTWSRYDTSVCALYIMKCDTCEPVVHAALRVHRNNYGQRDWFRIDKATGRVTHSGSSSPVHISPSREFVKYIRYDKKDFSKNWIIVKEKDLR